MSEEVRRDIEAEIGRKGWGLVSKVAGVMIIPALAGAIWVGALESKVGDHQRRLDRQSERINENLVIVRDVSLRQSAIVQNLIGIKERLDQIYLALEAIRERAERRQDPMP